LRWDAEYNRSNYGTWEQQNANSQRASLIDQATRLVQSSNAFYGMRSDEIENFAVELSQDFNRQNYGTALYNFYNQVRNSAWAALVEQVRIEVDGLRYSLASLQSVAEQLDSKFNRQNYGTVEYNSYNNARQLAFQGLVQAAQVQAQNARDHVEIEQALLEYNSRFNRENYGTVAYNTYNQIRDVLAQESQARFDNEARYMGSQQLYQLQQQYNSLQSRENYGTALYNYYGQMRDIARRYVGTRP
jgi:hypothetical protein